ncbi:MAG: hypothetical protein ABR576_04120 [Thermoanaerobaculia bacterium]
MNENSNPDAREAAPIPPPPPPVVPPPPVPVVVPMIEKKSPGLAGFLSIFFPGLGHLYLGLYQRAFTLAAAFAFSIFAAHNGPGEFFGPVIAFVWFFGIFDAVRQARAINLGQVVEGGFAPAVQIREAAQGTGALTWGVIMVGFGTLWLIDRYVEIDWSFLEDWGAPLAFILLGFVLIITHVTRKRRENTSEMDLPPRSR